LQLDLAGAPTCISTELLTQLRETAETEAIKIFVQSARAARGTGRSKGGARPRSGIRTGCKVAVVDATGKLLKRRRFIRTNRATIGTARCSRWHAWLCSMASN
jgi:transcriptional accessory protein Tex/SPT6